MQLVAMLVGQFVGLAVGSLIGALFLCLAARWVARVDLPYSKSWTTAFGANVVSWLIGIAAGAGMAAARLPFSPPAALALLGTGFLIQAGFVSRALNVSFGRGCLVALVAGVLGLVIGGAVLLVVGGLLNASGALR